MEFSFGDDLFETESRNDRRKKDLAHYEAKLCSTEWFMEKNFNDKDLTLDDCQTIKFQADLLYYKKNYQSALEKYKERLQYMLHKNNNSMLREVHGSIINCYLKLQLLEEAKVHVDELMKTSGNPYDSYIHFLGYQVHHQIGNVKESGEFLFSAISINPWYVDYWLRFYKLLYSCYNNQNECFTLKDVSLDQINVGVLKLLVIHIEFIYGENKKSNINSNNLKNGNTEEKIKEYWSTLAGKDYEDIRKNTQELYHKISRVRDGNTDDHILKHPCFYLYKKFMLKPIEEAKNF